MGGHQAPLGGTKNKMEIGERTGMGDVDQEQLLHELEQSLDKKLLNEEELDIEEKVLESESECRKKFQSIETGNDERNGSAII